MKSIGNSSQLTKSEIYLVHKYISVLYTSAAFQEFSRSYGFTHVTSSPMYPQSNEGSFAQVQGIWPGSSFGYALSP